MAASPEIRPVDRLGIELLEILLSVHLLKQTAADGDDFFSQARNLKVVTLLVNDIIVRLGKFREDDNRNWSFREVSKALAKSTVTDSRAVAVGPAIKEFLQNSKWLKDYRNLAVAHLPKRGAANLKPLTELYQLVTLAVKVVDILAGEKNQYKVGEVNLREVAASSEDA